jgi:hypothetical protein
MNDCKPGGFVIPTWAIASVIWRAPEKKDTMTRPEEPRTKALRLARPGAGRAEAEAKWGEG